MEASGVPAATGLVDVDVIEGRAVAVPSCVLYGARNRLVLSFAKRHGLTAGRDAGEEIVARERHFDVRVVPAVRIRIAIGRAGDSRLGLVDTAVGRVVRVIARVVSRGAFDSLILALRRQGLRRRATREARQLRLIVTCEGHGDVGVVPAVRVRLRIL